MRNERNAAAASFTTFTRANHCHCHQYDVLASTIYTQSVALFDVDPHSRRSTHTCSRPIVVAFLFHSTFAFFFLRSSFFVPYGFVLVGDVIANASSRRWRRSCSSSWKYFVEQDIHQRCLIDCLFSALFHFFPLTFVFKSNQTHRLCFLSVVFWALFKRMH